MATAPACRGRKMTRPPTEAAYIIPK
jgi:hypothetical protein